MEWNSKRPDLRQSLFDIPSMTSLLNCTDSMALMAEIRPLITERQLRLAATACVRRAWHLLKDERSRAAVDIAERVADKHALKKDMKPLRAAAWDAHLLNTSAQSDGSCANAGAAFASWAAWWVAAPKPIDVEEVFSIVPVAIAHAAQLAGASTNSVVRLPAFTNIKVSEDACQADLIRDVIGNPFAPAKLEPAWLNSHVRELAAGIYAKNEFETILLLGDALEEAGCSDESILLHCRQPATHIRGCWLVDAIRERGGIKARPSARRRR